VLQFERRTLPGERSDTALVEATTIIDKLRREDREFDASARMTFGRDAYEIAGNHAVPQSLLRIAVSAGCTSSLVGMTFWTDAAILAGAGIPSVLFGPGGAGLHSIEEYVWIEDVCRCRDVLVEFTRSFT
jgi:acetylornithine deacetylase